MFNYKTTMRPGLPGTIPVTDSWRGGRAGFVAETTVSAQGVPDVIQFGFPVTRGTNPLCQAKLLTDVKQTFLGICIALGNEVNEYGINNGYVNGQEMKIQYKLQSRVSVIMAQGVEVKPGQMVTYNVSTKNYGIATGNVYINIGICENIRQYLPNEASKLVDVAIMNTEVIEPLSLDSNIATDDFIDKMNDLELRLRYLTDLGGNLAEKVLYLERLKSDYDRMYQKHTDLDHAYRKLYRDLFRTNSNVSELNRILTGRRNTIPTRVSAAQQNNIDGTNASQDNIDHTLYAPLQGNIDDSQAQDNIDHTMFAPTQNNIDGTNASQDNIDHTLYTPLQGNIDDSQAQDNIDNLFE